MSRLPIRILQVLLPFVLVGGAGLTAYLMYLNRPLVETQPPVFAPPGVRVQPVVFDTVSLTVTSQGTVQPRTTSQLVPEISGPITEAAPSFAVGGFFEAGDVLLKIDPFDYQQAVIAARSQVAQARLRLAQEDAEAEMALREWEELGRGNASALTLRQPQVEEARAAIAAAEATLDLATRDLERAEIRAPYRGRVRSKDVDVGQFVSKGNPVARIYAIDSAEIRLPLPDAELAYIDVALSYRGGEQRTGPRVTLSTDFAGRRHTWQGRIVRTDSEIDPASRMVHLVAEVRDPYAPGPDPSRPPLAAGMFVEAEIEGRTVGDIVVLPWAALRGRDRVLVVDESSRLRYRQVEVMRSTSDEVLVRGGLAEGELVCVSPLDTVTSGMAVRVLDGDSRLTRATTGDTRTLPGADLSAPAAGTNRASEAATPTAGDFDIDPTLSREEQIAAIRRRLETLRNPPIASRARAAPDASPDRRAAAPPRVVAAGAGASAEAPGAAADARGPGGAGARAGRSNRREQRGRAGRGGPGARGQGRADRLAATRAAPSATPHAEPDTAASPAAPTAELDDARAASRAVAERDPVLPADPGPRLGVAVLPFANVSRNPADDRLGGDMADAMAGGLRQLDGVSTVMLDAEDEVAALDAATARNAAWLISGGYQHVGGRLRITARLLDVATGELMRTVKVDGTLDELPGLLTEVVFTLRTALRQGIGSAARLPDRMPDAAEARR